MNTTSLTPSVDDASTLERSRFNEWFEEEFNKAMQKRDDDHVPSLSIIASKGTLDWAYPPFIIASTAAALGWDASIFFTFYGLDLLKKDLDLNVSPLGNPAMPMKMPFGPEWFRGINWKIPNLIMGNTPGFESFATAMMQSTLNQKGVASIEDLRSLCIEADVNFYACQMTVDLFGHRKEEFIPEISEWIGATSYLAMAAKCDVTLYM